MTARLFPLLAAVLLLSACGESEDAPVVRSYVEGRVTVRADVDSIPDYRGFELFVLAAGAERMDTLGYAITDSAGYFAMDVTAPDRGIYSFVLSRRGTVLKADEMVVADGDSVRLQAEVPLGSRALRFRSRENGAWMAYRNAKAQYGQSVVRLVNEEGADGASLARNVAQTANILWSLQETYPETLGADVAAAESIVMLQSWDDSLLVARARTVSPESPGFVEVARAARRAEARRGGQAAALAMLDAFAARTEDPERAAALLSERVLAHMDSLEREPALAAARRLQRDYAETPWAEWAEGTVYELEHLMPGMPAPALEAMTPGGAPFRLDSLRGRHVVLEFFRPEDPAYRRQLGEREALRRAVGDEVLAFVTVSLESDALRNEAFWESYPISGVHLVAPGGAAGAVARAYNVRAVPTRFLIDPQGRILGRYVGETFAALQQALLTRLAGEDLPPSTP